VRIGWCDIDAGLRKFKDMITERMSAPTRASSSRRPPKAGLDEDHRSQYGQL